MPKLLKRYLLVTGILAFVAITMPGLVAIGLFLIIPGLLLGLAPTAFMWGCFFTLGWALVRRFASQPIAMLAGVAVTAAIAFAVPWPSQQAGRKLLDSSLMPDISPSGRVAPAGDVRLDIQPRPDNKNPPVKGYVRAYSCDNLCVTLLFTPGVRSVTVNDSGPFTPEQHRQGTGEFSTGSRTYRLLPKAECGGREIKPDIEGRVGLVGKTLEDNRAIESEWNLKLSSESCIVAEPPISHWDVMLRQGHYSYPDKDTKRGPWSLATGRAQVTYVEIHGGNGDVSLRRLISRVSVLARPFSISPSGGLENFHFGWTRETLSNARRYAEGGDLVSILKAHGTLAERAPAADLLPQIRKRLQQAVADPALPATDPAFATLETYFGGIAAKPLGDTDRALVKSLILDERLTSYRGIYHLKKLPPDQHREVRDAIVHRLLTTGKVPALVKSELGNVFTESPKGAFVKLSKTEQQLLATPDRRVAAPGMVARLSDAGAAPVPLLIDLLRHHADALTAALASKENATDRSARIHTHSRMVEAARVAFCRIGGAGSSALPQIEAMISGGVIPAYSLNGHGGMEWDLTLVRLGKPLDSIKKAENLSGSEANYRRNMEEKLRRFKPDQSCGRV